MCFNEVPLRCPVTTSRKRKELGEGVSVAFVGDMLGVPVALVGDMVGDRLGADVYR
eukprot:gene8841-biopygen7653